MNQFQNINDAIIIFPLVIISFLNFVLQGQAQNSRFQAPKMELAKWELLSAKSNKSMKPL